MLVTESSTTKEVPLESLLEGDSFHLANGAITSPRLHISRDGVRDDRGQVVVVPSGILVHKIVEG
jgi:hypothetical protein